MKLHLKIFIAFLFFAIGADLSAQQYPWFTQYRSNLYMFNPGFCGTRRTVDFRMFYRNQWQGYDGAPKTYAASLNFRYFKGKLGTGAFVFKDDIGPFQTINAALTFAYHLKFDDVELSVGAQGHYIAQTFNGTKVTLHNQIDRGINQYLSDNSHAFDGSFGAVLYNDRFFFAIAANNLVGSEMKYYVNSPFYKGTFKNEATYSIGAGYNFSENKDFVWENSIMALYTTGVPFYLDYTLRLHVKNQFFAGISFRPKDAIAVHLGLTVKNIFQVAYSYDILFTPLSAYQNGSHEIKLIFSTNAGTDTKRRGFNKQFIRQKYQYMLN